MENLKDRVARYRQIEDNEVSVVRMSFSCDLPLLELAFVLLAVAICPLAAQISRSTGKSNHVTLTYMGTAAWEISDGNTVILVDPNLSRILVPLHGAGSAATGRVPEILAQTTDGTKSCLLT